MAKKVSSKTMMKKAGVRVEKSERRHRYGRGYPMNISDLYPMLDEIAKDYGIEIPTQKEWAKKGKGTFSREENSRDIKVGDMIIHLASYNDFILLTVPNPSGEHLTLHYNGKYYIEDYCWPGRGRLVSDKPIDPEFMVELSKVKEEELAKAKEKRRTKIRNNMDAVRLLFEESDIECKRIAGAVRVEAAMSCSIDFEEDGKNSTKIRVRYHYQTGFYQGLKDITTLDLADPNFLDHAKIIVHNFSNLWDIVVGKKELKEMPFNIGKMK